MTDPNDADRPGLDEGDVLETALIGPPIGDVLPLWTSAGRLLWRVEDPDQIRTLVGAGRLARTERESDRYREIALANPSSGTVMLLPRMHGSPGDSQTVGGKTLAGRFVEDAEVPAADDETWSAFARWLGAVYVLAARRSEFIVVELGGWDFRDEPYAMAFAATDADPPTNHLESNPRPDGASMWPPGDDPRGQTISAPISKDTMGATGLLLADAIRTWASSPLDLAVTFATSAHSPLTG